MENFLSLLCCHYSLLIFFQCKYQVMFWIRSLLRCIWIPLSKFCLAVSHYVMFYVQVYGNYSQLPKHPGKECSIYVLCQCAPIFICCFQFVFLIFFVATKGLWSYIWTSALNVIKFKVSHSFKIQLSNY